MRLEIKLKIILYSLRYCHNSSWRKIPLNLISCVLKMVKTKPWTFFKPGTFTVVFATVCATEYIVYYLGLQQRCCFHVGNIARVGTGKTTLNQSCRMQSKCTAFSRMQSRFKPLSLFLGTSEHVWELIFETKLAKIKQNVKQVPFLVVVGFCSALE